RPRHEAGPQSGPLRALQITWVAGHHQHLFRPDVKVSRWEQIDPWIGLVAPGELAGQDAVERHTRRTGKPGKESDAAVGQRGEQIALTQRGQSGHGIWPGRELVPGMHKL